jgi:GDP-L-fucose synthase|tara:strand:- start:2181 stop:3092 length:912 start_codon:yes stop_codon:yes gene_type:complete
MPYEILITGATGFLGRHLTQALQNENFKITISNSKVNSLDDISNLKGLEETFDYIFHLAAVTKAGDYCLRHQGDQWISNQKINTNILDYWKNYQPQAKMICMGTSCSYSPDLPMVESNYLKGEPEEGLYTYAMTKRMLLTGLQSIGKQYGLKWLYFIPSTLYGPDFELDDNHFIFDLIRNCYNAKHKGDRFVIWGDGNQRRELVYVKDAVNIMLSLLQEENQIFNIASGKDYSINEFSKKVCELIGYEYNKVERDLSKYVGVKEKLIDTKKTQKALDECLVAPATTPLEKGLKTAINYFTDNI